MSAILTRTLAVALLLLAACSTVPDASDEEQPAGNRELPIARLIDRTNEDPENPKRHYELGNALFDLQRFNEARAAYTRVVELDDKFADAHTNLGLTYRLLNDLPSAIEHYEKSLALQPEDPITLQNIIIVLMAKGMKERAAVHLGSLAELRPNDVGVQDDLANLLFELKHYPEAAAQYAKVVSLDPTDLAARFEAGSVYFQLEDWDKAIATWVEILALDPNDGKAHLGLAMAHWRKKNYDAAWKSVSECQRVGMPLPPKFVSTLQSDSGRLGPG